MANAEDDAAGARARLRDVQAKRGYLLPHHGLLAVAAPELLAGYDAAYTALTLRPRPMSEHDKEFVWLVILTATEEALATHHIQKFRDAGGGDALIETAFRLAAYARGAPCFAFAAERWSGHLPGYDAERAYRDGLARLVAGEPVSPALVEMAMAAAQACRRGWDQVAWHLRGAYAAGADEYELAEAISYVMFPGSVPNFVDACGVWLQLIRDGAVDASPPFRAWAELEGQGGFDEAAGTAS